MKKILDPLADIPGVRRAMLISKDGVPITHLTNEDELGRVDPRPWADSSEDLSAFAGMAASLLVEIKRSVDPLSWSAPQRIEMRAARGTLVLVQVERATLTVELVRGMAPEELRLPIESVVARLQRVLARESKTNKVAEVTEEHESLPGPLPGSIEQPGDGAGSQVSPGNEVPEITRES